MHHGTIPPCGWELACAISSARDARSRHHDDCRAVPTRPSAVAPDRALPRGCRGSLEPALSLMSCQLSSATRLTTGRPAGRSTDRGPCVARRVYTRLSLLFVEAGSSRPVPRDRLLAANLSRGSRPLLPLLLFLLRRRPDARLRAIRTCSIHSLVGMSSAIILFCSARAIFSPKMPGPAAHDGRGSTEDRTATLLQQ